MSNKIIELGLDLWAIGNIIGVAFLGLAMLFAIGMVLYIVIGDRKRKKHFNKHWKATAMSSMVFDDMQHEILDGCVRGPIRFANGIDPTAWNIQIEVKRGSLSCRVSSHGDVQYSGDIRLTVSYNERTKYPYEGSLITGDFGQREEIALHKDELENAGIQVPQSCFDADGYVCIAWIDMDYVYAKLYGKERQ